MDPAVAAILASALTGIITFFTTARTAKTNLEVADLTARTQYSSVEMQVGRQIAAEVDRQKRLKIEESYGNLMKWMHDLDRTVEAIFLSPSSPDEEELVRCMKIVDKWPFETLEPPEFVAATSFAWSDEVTELVESFRGDSADFVFAACTLLCDRMTSDQVRKAVDPKIAQRREESTRLRSKEELTDARARLWDGRRKLKGNTQDVRRQVRLELLGR